jgi:SAM-dependent methyltransferase
MIATKDRRPTTSRGSEWFESWFDSIHYHRLYAYRDEREARQFVEALVRKLSVQDGARVLDLGCGAGRHARQLAESGLRVTGIDLSAASIAQARRAGQPGLRFLRRDMREPFGNREFDCVFNLFTSFGYFDDERTHERVVANISRSLRPGGRLVLDYLNVGYAEPRLVPNEVVELEGVLYRISRWSNSTHFFKRIVVEDRRGAPLEHIERVAKFTVADFDRMFRASGLLIESLYGDYLLGEYQRRVSPRLILVARRSDRAVANPDTTRCEPEPLLPREVFADPAERLG